MPTRPYRDKSGRFAKRPKPYRDKSGRFAKRSKPYRDRLGRFASVETTYSEAPIRGDEGVAFEVGHDKPTFESKKGKAIEYLKSITNDVDPKQEDKKS